MDVSLVVPAHNEEGNIERVVDRVFAALGDREYGIEIVLVDDNSTDETPRICDRLEADHPEVVVVHRTSDPGFGNAIKDGLRVASGDVLIPFMADLSDDPEDIPKLVSAIQDGFDVAYGSRFVARGEVEGYPPLKLLYNRSYNNLIRVLFGLQSRDVTNAFTAYRREVIEEIGIENLHSDSFDLTAELPLRAHIHGFKSTEVPVSWRSRDVGVSKLNATRKGPLYLKRLLHMFFVGNVVGLKDLFGAITSGSPARILGATVLGILILLGLFSLSGFDEVYQLLAETNVAWLGLGAGAYLLSFAFRTWRYRVFLRTADHLASRGAVIRSILAGWFVNFILPARAGDAVRGLALKTTEGVPFGVGLGFIAVERAFDMAILGGTMSIVTLLLLDSDRAAFLAVGALGIAALLVVALALVYAFEPRVTALLEASVPQAAGAIAELNRSLERIATNPYAMILAFLLSVPVWAFEMSTLYFSARALGIDLSLVPAVAGAVAGFVAQAVPITPAGIGTYEATIAGILAVFDYPTSTGTAIALIDHFMRAAVTYVVGAISIVHISFQSRTYFRQRAGNDLDPVDTGGDVE